MTSFPARSAALSVLLLDGARLEIPGAVAHPDSFPAPTDYRVVPGAGGAVVAGPDFGDVEGAYVAAARGAVRAGATMLSSNCGFAVAYQDAVQRAAGAPATALSSLLLVPLLSRVYGRRLGVLTFDAAQLDGPRRHMSGWPAGVELPVADVQHSAAWRALNAPVGAHLDVDRMRSDLLRTAEDFVRGNDLAALLLECTGFCPFAVDLMQSIELPAYDIVGLISFLLTGGRVAPAAEPDGQVSDGAATAATN